MPRIPEAGIAKVLWPANGPAIYTVLIWLIQPRCPALPSATRTLAFPLYNLVEGKIDRDLFRYDGLCAPGNMETVVFSNTPGDCTILKTPQVITRDHPICPGSSGIDDKPCQRAQAANLPPRALQKGKSRA
jgi:hypothetical protein